MGNINGIYNVGVCYDNGTVVKVDKCKAFFYYKKAAEMGHAKGAFNIGVFYGNGIGIGKNEYIAFSYYQKSADMGYIDGMIQVGFCYQHGIGVERDEYKAFIYYQKASEMGNASGTYNLGVCYDNGIGVSKDERKAFICYYKAAEMNHVDGIFNLGVCYNDGIGVGKDEYIAFICYKKCADMGYAIGINQIAYCYQNGIGVENDDHKAFIYYQESANMGNTKGMNLVGHCYRKGIGVKKNERMAVTYYKKSAKLDDPDGAYSLGYCYFNGIGVEKNEDKAFIYYSKSAEKGHAQATTQVGYCYQNGIGVEKNENTAFIYFQKSAEMGDFNGMYYIGYCYEHGIGIENNESMAFFYYHKSSEIGCPNGIMKVGYCYQNGIGVKRDEHMAFSHYKKYANMGYTVGMHQLGYCYQNGIGTEKNLLKANYWYEMERDNLSVTNEWVDKNVEIDNELKNILKKGKHSLLWIPYNEFKHIEETGQGGFSTVYYADWFDKTHNIWRPFALKLFHGSSLYNKEFIKELETYCDSSHENPLFLKCYGLSRDNDSKDYILILKRARIGSLRKNLRYIAGMEWINKIDLLRCISYDLKIIHSQGLIHRNLHSRNILQDNFSNAYIADLGLSILPNIASKAEDNIDKVYGILPYMAPEILDGTPYTETSDIYSFGIIMWEILYGKPVGYDQDDELQLQIQICNDDLRPTVCEYAPQCYVNLMKECWIKNPEIRPSADTIYNIFTNWQKDQEILLELSKSDEKLETLRYTYNQTYSKPFNRGKFIPYTNSLIDEPIVDYEN